MKKLILILLLLIPFWTCNAHSEVEYIGFHGLFLYPTTSGSEPISINPRTNFIIVSVHGLETNEEPLLTSCYIGNDLCIHYQSSGTGQRIDILYIDDPPHGPQDISWTLNPSIQTGVNIKIFLFGGVDELNDYGIDVGPDAEVLDLYYSPGDMGVIFLSDAQRGSLIINDQIPMNIIGSDYNDRFFAVAYKMAEDLKSISSADAFIIGIVLQQYLEPPGPPGIVW